MIKLLLGGSPCTYWSIAQKNNRETTASGLGWELFRNYVIAKEKFNPDFFLYENNKSASTAIKEQIKKELKVWDGSLFMEDTGARYIEINSALVSAQNRQRFYVHNCGDVKQPEDRCILLCDILENDVTKSIRIPAYCNDDKSRPVRASYSNKGNGIGSLQSECFTENQIKQVSDYIAVPINTTSNEKSQTIKAQYGFTSVQNICCYSSTYGASGVATTTTEEQYNELKHNKNAIDKAYEVKEGKIIIKDKKYPVKLKDGFYTIRKLTVKECCRLQTMPDDYCKSISDYQAYKCLGNGWTAEVIIHILNGALKNVPRDEEIVVLSMYDGIATGMYCLDKMGFKNVKYYAYEIDKYAIQVAKDNYPNIIECGDAFQVRNEHWSLGG